MKEYISKEYINNLLERHLNNWCGPEYYACSIIEDEISDTPDSEIIYVKHGYWMKSWCDNNIIGHEYEECSNCGCSMIDTNQFWDSKFCPRCGSIMDKESSNGRN
jgi:ribosomal protein S27AE